MSRASTRRGVTLVELLATIAVLAVVSGIVTMAVRRIDPSDATDPQQMVIDSLRAAIAQSRRISIVVTRNGLAHRATMEPDGGVIADSLFHFDRLDGRRRDAR